MNLQFRRFCSYGRIGGPKAGWRVEQSRGSESLCRRRKLRTIGLLGDECHIGRHCACAPSTVQFVHVLYPVQKQYCLYSVAESKTAEQRRGTAAGAVGDCATKGGCSRRQ